ncbi:ATP-binding protein [Actinotalea caeni]|uniref:ATP-binding protein n=1 Tax=Actinotalea caeni TaxID=1348467 RepID=UPI0012E2B4E7|nr:ATP-binding protein [Actinotalea caeni]
MNETPTHEPDELPAVAALRLLSVFSAHQGGAYREHFGALSDALGADVETKLARFVVNWAAERTAGIVVLTGNAGTGKTAVAEAYCKATGSALPTEDTLVEIAPGQRVVKDLSGLPDAESRAAVVRTVLELGSGQTLLCANEGVLRDALTDTGATEVAHVLDQALRHGATRVRNLTIVNVNRQRPTGDPLWGQLIDYVTREEIWGGCADCPFESGGCPMRSNAERLRRGDVREQLRTLVRVGSGEAVPTLREVLAILAWAIVGPHSCSVVKKAHRDRGASAFTATDGYFGRILGQGLAASASERSPLLTGMRRSGLGAVSDLEVDGWLRDASGAPERVRQIAGDPHITRPDHCVTGRTSGLAGSTSPLDRVRTAQGELTFYALGEMVSTDEDPTRVEDGLDALVHGDGVSNAPAERLWRQLVFFEASEDLGGEKAAARRLLDYRHVVDLVELARKTAAGGDTVIELNEIVRGLNFLVTGFSSPNEGLIVPDPACLFARDPGSFRPAQPSLVHSQVQLESLSLRVPDSGLVEELLDVDHVDVELIVQDNPDLALRISPRMYEAIREAAAFQGPVGQGVAEMNDLRGFYGRLAAHLATDRSLRVADPDSNPPALVTISLPHFVKRAT